MKDFLRRLLSLDSIIYTVCTGLALYAIGFGSVYLLFFDGLSYKLGFIFFFIAGVWFVKQRLYVLCLKYFKIKKPE